ncbi:MAG: hypothetical protein CFE26_04335 [Verrucomicrobiales bacterium VVV1]|nr:MAG: hypothetical protein CFE26_04335 [Verrucomicrobiales bacterium VVV1]
MWSWVQGLGTDGEAKKEHIHVSAVVEDSIGLYDLNLGKLANTPPPVFGECTRAEDFWKDREHLRARLGLFKSGNDKRCGFGDTASRPFTAFGCRYLAEWWIQ